MERFIKVISAIVIIALISCGAFVSYSLFAWNEVYEKLPTADKTITVINKNGEKVIIDYKKESVHKGNPFTVLLLGVDEVDVTKGRSDSIILATVQPKEKKVTLLSIPRDSYIKNSATGNKDKITHAYNNGVANTIASLEEYFNIPIDYYATINFDGFRGAIDALGGIEINAPKSFSFQDRISKTNFSITAGTQTMDGLTALNYARYRGDSDGDFGRNKRQREILTALASKATNLSSISKINSILDILKTNIKTNIQPSEMYSILFQLDFGNELNIESLTIEATPGRAGKVSIVKVTDTERERISQELQRKLNLIQ